MTQTESLNFIERAITQPIRQVSPKKIIVIGGSRIGKTWLAGMYEKMLENGYEMQALEEFQGLSVDLIRFDETIKPVIKDFKFPNTMQLGPKARRKYAKPR